MKHLINANGFAAGGLLNPAIFGYGAATAGDPGACRDDEPLGRLNVTGAPGYRTDASSTPRRVARLTLPTAA